MKAKKRKKKVARAKSSGSKRKLVRAKKKTRAKKTVRRKRRARRAQQTIYEIAPIRPEIFAGKAGQSGDVQGLSEVESADSESVAELAEEGQDYEAEVVSGVENALDPDQGEVRTREVPEDDVPPEYRNPEQ
ncbi:MAG TPA: hypothetical protein VEU52_02570 [Candidatus Limnocylindrales bacterium]|nr:hypothetical protein [Candidatus Limnocylindrales bacterium]